MRCIAVKFIQLFLQVRKRQLPAQRTGFTAVTPVGNAGIRRNLGNAAVGLLFIGEILNGFAIEVGHVKIVQEGFSRHHDIGPIAHFFAAGAVGLHAEYIAQKGPFYGFVAIC
jgi:hypothetical protein